MNPANDRDIKEEIPKLLRQLYLLDLIKKETTALKIEIKSILSETIVNAYEHGYSKKEILTSPMNLYVNENIGIRRAIKKMIDHNPTAI